MTMQTYNDADGRQRFVLGPMEVAIASIIPAMLLGLLVWLGSSVMDRLDKAGETMERLGTQQAVMTAQLTTLSLQLADVPALNVRLSRVEVKQEANTELIKELRGTKGLK